MAVIPYIGGKTFQAPWIVFHFPPGYERIGYLEPFGGSLAVFFWKRPSRVEVLNDKDEDVLNFWMVVQERGEELAREAAKLPYSRKLYERWGKEWWKLGRRPLDPFERALRFFYLMRTNRSGHLAADKGWRCGIKTNYAEAYRNACREIEYAQKRLERVQLECRDFREVIEQYDDEECLMYVDPPYVDMNYYQVKFKREDHEELAELLNRAKAKVIISLYPHPLVDELYPEGRWQRFTRTFDRKAPNLPEDRSEATELLLTNYEPGGSLKLWEGCV